MSGLKAGSRRPLFRKRPPLGRWGVTRKFACTLPSKAGLCPWPRVTGTDCGKWCSRKYFPESWKICRFSALAAEVGRVGRRGLPPWQVDLRPTAPGTGCLGFSAENPLPDQSLVPLKSRPGSRPSGGFVAHLAFDHQMTPTLFAGAFRAFGPPEALSFGSAVGHACGGPPT